MPAQQFGQELLMDGYDPPIQLSQLLFVIIDHDYVMAEVRETRPRHQSYIARAHHRNPHFTLRAHQQYCPAISRLSLKRKHLINSVMSFLFSTPFWECPLAGAGNPHKNPQGSACPVLVLKAY